MPPPSEGWLQWHPPLCNHIALSSSQKTSDKHKGRFQERQKIWGLLQEAQSSEPGHPQAEGPDLGAQGARVASMATLELWPQA